MSPDLGESSDNRKLTGFGCFGPSDKVSDWSSAARTNVVFTNSYVDNNSSLICE
jgi:hypothetical protein